MALDFQDETEAFLAVLSAVVAADQVGSLEERDFLFGRVKDLDIMKGRAADEFRKMLGRVTEKVFETLPTDGGALTASGLDQLLDAATKKLSASGRKELLAVATELCKKNDTSDSERALLTKLEQRLSGS